MQEQVPYGAAIAKKYPEQVVVAVAKDPDGKCNPMSIGWTTIASGEPPMLLVAINLRAHTAAAIRHSREFVIAFPSVEMGEDVVFFGTHSGRDVDKLAARGTRTEPATQIDCVLLSDAVANFECVLETAVETGDHALFVGRVVAAHVNQDAERQRLYSLGGGALGSVRVGEETARR